MPDGYFTDDSMLRRIHRERAVALSGPRALLMQATHPLAVSGLLAHSNALDASLAQRVLGWTPKTDLREGMRLTLGSIL